MIVIEWREAIPKMSASSGSWLVCAKLGNKLSRRAPCFLGLGFIDILIKCQCHNVVNTKRNISRHLADILYEFFGSKVFTRELTKLWTFTALISWNNDSIAHSRYITILTRLNRLRGFLVILPNLVWSSLCSSLFWELRGSRVVKNLQFWPQSLGVIRILIYRMWVIVCAWEACTILSRARDWVGVVSNCSMGLF